MLFPPHKTATIIAADHKKNHCRAHSWAILILASEPNKRIIPQNQTWGSYIMDVHGSFEMREKKCNDFLVINFADFLFLCFLFCWCVALFHGKAVGISGFLRNISFCIDLSRWFFRFGFSFLRSFWSWALCRFHCRSQKRQSHWNVKEYPSRHSHHWALDCQNTLYISATSFAIS